MASIIVNVERWNDTGMAFVRSRASDAPEADKDVIRPIDYDIFRDTCLPADYQLRAGALTTLLFGFSERTVLRIEIRRFDGVGVWVADALVDTGDQTVYRRGTAANPVDALVDLAFDVQMLD
jgi:hypothetical protein